MQFLKKALPWILFAVAAVAFGVFYSKYNKAKAANKTLADNLTNEAADPENSGIAGGLVETFIDNAQ